MQITNKKLAFYIALILATIDMGLAFTGYITLDQARLGLLAIAGICAPLGILDAVYDYLGIIFRVAETVVSLTPSTKDDEALIEFKNVVKIAQETHVPDNEAGLAG